MDGSLCTMTNACPWSMVAWTKSFAALSQRVTAAMGAAMPSPTPLQAAVVQVAASWCECCQRVVDAPYHHDNHNPPYDGYDYCQGCYDAGCGDPNDPCSWTPGQEAPGGPVSTNPITPQMLRDDWPDNPSLSKSERHILASLGHSQIQDALDLAMSGYEDVWYNMLDEVRGIATRNLLASVPRADSADEDTKDVCSNCGLPITMTSGSWTDDIMGSDDCSNAGEGGDGHAPQAVLAAYLKALSDGARAKQAQSGAGFQMLVTLKDANPSALPRYLLVSVPSGDQQRRVTDVLADLLGGALSFDNQTITFSYGGNSDTDALWENLRDIVRGLADVGIQAQIIFPLCTIDAEG